MGKFCIKIDIFDGSITAQWAKIGQKENLKFRCSKSQITCLEKFQSKYSQNSSYVVLKMGTFQLIIKLIFFSDQ